jgi:ferredoxin-NADP reductase
VIYFDELMQLRALSNGLEIFHTFTRQQPPGWDGYARRIDAQMLREVAEPLGKDLRAYICGPTLLVESVADGLVQIGIPPGQIRTERFGPTGNQTS